MKAIVCVKVINGEINPFDESAIECALEFFDDVTVISMCPKQAEPVLKQLTRLKVKVILISDPLYAGSDTLATAYILSEAIKHMEYDMILCGRQSVDGDTAQVGPMISEMLGIGLITNVVRLENNGSGMKAITRMGEEYITDTALVTLERSYILRFPSIFSKVTDISMWSNENIGCDVSKCGLEGSPTRVIKTFENERGKRNCNFISYDELIPLIEEIKKKTRVNTEKTRSDKRLKSVWAVGEEVLEEAHAIAENVVFIDKTEPKEIANLAIKEKPEVILWNADLWGRKNAPIAAAILNTGLCADCTELETDGERLFMYRPARSGSITAKIICNTYPQMATVRTKSVSSDIILSVGRGVKDKIDKAKELAKSIGAEMGASRGLVDENIAPYENQIGLTGKTVSPKIYIAIGISGAVHHTCAIERCDTVIAINPDKNARIFDYADYGIITEF